MSDTALIGDDLEPWETWIALIHAEPGVGKSTLGHTTPAPRLILDSENGARFYRGEKVYWTDLASPPPECNGSVIVPVREWDQIEDVYAWLNSGKHNFRSVVMDSLTEIQRRCKDTIDRKNGVLTEQGWGFLLDHMEKVVRDIRDLTMHPTTPVNCVLILSHCDEKKGMVRPLVQGGLAMSLPGFVDSIGYYAVREGDQGEPVRRLLFQPIDGYVAKDRTDALPITWDVPKGEKDTVTRLIRRIHREESEAA